MTTTTNLGLKKPSGSDRIRVDDLNGNADLLDAVIGKLDELNTTQKQSLVAAINASLGETAQSAAQAAASAAAAEQSKTAAAGSADAAAGSASSAAAAKTDAETARAAAETAKTDAVAAKTAAESAAASVVESETSAASSAATATEKAIAAEESAAAAAQSAAAAQAVIKPPMVIPATLTAENWTGDASPYRQAVTVPSGTANSKVDVQADADALDALTAAGVTAIYVENVGGVFAVVVLGEKPTEDITVQLTRTEVDEYTEEV